MNLNLYHPSHFERPVDLSNEENFSFFDEREFKINLSNFGHWTRNNVGRDLATGQYIFSEEIDETKPPEIPVGETLTLEYIQVEKVDNTKKSKPKFFFHLGF
jgi:hypothetical protein